MAAIKGLVLVFGLISCSSGEESVQQQINDAIRILGKRSLAAGEIVSEKLAVQLLANKVRYLRWLYISCLAVSNEGREHLVPLTDTSIPVLEIRRFLPIFELRTLLDDQF